MPPNLVQLLLINIFPDYFKRKILRYSNENVITVAGIRVTLIFICLMELVTVRCPSCH